MSRDCSEQYPYGYYKGGGWDIDTSDKTQREGDSGHIPGRFQWEETVDVSADDDDDDGNDDNPRSCCPAVGLLRRFLFCW